MLVYKQIFRYLTFKVLIVAVSFCFLWCSAQTEVKINAPFIPIGIFNGAVEKAVTEKISVQAEVFVSPWKSFAGKNLQIYMGTLEGRYYFDEVMKKWYVGAYGSIALFNLQKWNYYNASTVPDENGNPQRLPDGSIRMTERFQKGVSFIFGISGGYHFEINSKLWLDVFAGIGTSQSIYKGYLKDNYERYDGAKKWNKSGEMIPTRVGVMFTYKL